MQNAPKKAKGSSKKTKKGWRKNVDITQEEDFLEDQRLEERLGGPFNEKADEELFVIDNKAEDNQEVTGEPSKKWRKKREEKPSKCFPRTIKNLETTTKPFLVVEQQPTTSWSSNHDQG